MYWSATMHDHVVCESRLELSRLIFADIDHAVRRILAQPILLKAKVDGKIRKHIPDYFLVTDQGPVVVDVKPEHLLAKVNRGLPVRVDPSLSGGAELAVRGLERGTAIRTGEPAVPRGLPAHLAVRRGLA
jgi:hypothetical protein